MAMCRSGLLLRLNAKPSNCVAQAEDCARHREGMFVLEDNSWQHSEERASKANGAGKQISRALKTRRGMRWIRSTESCGLPLVACLAGQQDSGCRALLRG